MTLASAHPHYSLKAASGLMAQRFSLRRCLLCIAAFIMLSGMCTCLYRHREQLNRHQIEFQAVEERFQRVAAILARLMEARPVRQKSAPALIATVKILKANLRAGPGTGHAPTQTVPFGTRLFIEHEEGRWLRVIAPSGERAWIRGDLVTRGKNDD